MEKQDSGVETCRWAKMTLFLPYPIWLCAEDRPWTCLRDPEPGPLADTAICHDCPRWEPRLPTTHTHDG